MAKTHQKIERLESPKCLESPKRFGSPKHLENLKRLEILKSINNIENIKITKIMKKDRRSSTYVKKKRNFLQPG